MDCRDAQDELLRSDASSLEGLPPGGLAAHVAGCDACRELLTELRRLEAAWRSIPLPAGAGRLEEQLVERFSRRVSGPGPGGGRTRPPTRRWAIAASVLFALGVGGLLASLPRASASSDIVERLVDWNLSLARAPSPADRGRLYEGRAKDLQGEVRGAGLAAEERELADSLLETAPLLARTEDPLAEADRFNDVADQLLSRMSTATRGGDDARAGRYARLYRRVRELGIESKIDVIEASGSLDFDRRRRLERLVLRDDDRMRALVALLERAPDSSRKQIKIALGVARVRPRPAGAPRARDRRQGGP